MKYIVALNGREVEVSLGPDGVRVGGAIVHAHLADVPGTPVRLVTIGDAVHRVLVRRGNERGRYTLWLDGHRIEVEVLDERTRAIRALSGAAEAPSGPAPLVAPMPGLVVRVHVTVGDSVQPGAPLVVMEAMKMENELRAQAAGTVRAVHATAGTAVEKGALLIELD